MNNLFLNQTDETPEINFNSNGSLLIKGISIPENVSNFYSPILTWISEFEKNLPAEVILTFEIEYINTSSSRAFIDLIKKIISLKSENCDLRIVWKYEKDDEDNLDLGKDLEVSVRSTFEFVEV